MPPPAKYNPKMPIQKPINFGPPHMVSPYDNIISPVPKWVFERRYP